MTSNLGRKAVHIASMQNTPAASAAAAIRRASSAVAPSGFSTSVCLPAPNESSATGRCALCGVAT